MVVLCVKPFLKPGKCFLYWYFQCLHHNVKNYGAKLPTVLCKGIDLDQELKPELLFCGKLLSDAADGLGGKSEIRSHHVLRYYLCNGRIGFDKIKIAFFGCGTE